MQPSPRTATSLATLFLVLPLLASADTAQEVLEATGVQGGLIVHLGCGDGKLTAALCTNDSYLVHGLDADPTNVTTARAHIQSLGLYGKVSVDEWRHGHLPYADNLVNLLVVTSDECRRARRDTLSSDEINRVLAPNGVAYVRVGDRWTKTVKPWPDEIDEWTHYLHDASNNAVADDTVVGPPKHYQWVAGPRWARSHDHLSTTSAVVSAKGRLFYIIDEAPTAFAGIPPKWRLVARDAFSGVLLWKRDVCPWEGHLRGFRTGPAELARRLVAVGDRVYVTLGYGKPITALDAATGETVQTYAETANALEIIWHEGALFAVVGDRLPDNTDGAARPVEPDNLWHWWAVYEETPPRKHLVALDADSGNVLWKKDDVDTIEMMPTTLAAADKRVFFQSCQEVLALDTAGGKVIWRAPRSANRKRPSWSAPTLVVHGDIVLSGDRAVQAPTPNMPETNKSVQWVVNSSGGHAPKGKIIAFSADTGKKLWESGGRECYNAPVDVLVVDGLVWSGNLVGRGEPGITTGRNVLTGEVARQRPKDQTFFKVIMGHHRCYRNKATTKYLVLGRDGIEFIDVATGEGHGNAWVRGACQYGVMPCNGLIYAPPHACACHIESKLSEFNCLAPASASPGPTAYETRLHRGPAYGARPHAVPPATGNDDWPTHRHDTQRSGRSRSVAPARLSEAWKARLRGGRLTAPVIANGTVFVACTEEHTVYALDADKGDIRWSFTAGGRVDSPPTIHEGTALFGCADGWIYCLRASDGELAWRCRAAPRERRIVAHGRLESPWPVGGSVLVLDDVVYAVAGRTTFLDGGMRLVRLDARRGTLLSERTIPGAALPDVLSSDGESVYLRHRRFNLSGEPQPANIAHLYSPAGFLDGTWWHRTYWMFGTTMRSGWGAWPNSGMQVPSGRLLVMDDSNVYGYGRLNQYHRNGSHVGLGRMQYLLYAADRDSGTAKAGPAQHRGKAPAAPKQVAARWATHVPVLVRGMVLSGETLFVAGPPDTTVLAPEDSTDAYRIGSVEALREQEAALAGKRGAKLLVVSSSDGKQLAEYELDAPPAWDGMAAALGRLFVSQTDGSVVCLDGERG